MKTEPLSERSDDARTLWSAGDDAFRTGNLARAYWLYTQAHDLIVDCPRLHLEAHRKLIRVTALHKDKREFLTDWLLIKLAPLGVFEIVAFAMRSTVRGAADCRRAAPSKI